MDIFEVKLTKKVEEKLSSLPKPVVFKLLHWVETVKFSGLRETRKIPGFHDEPIKGKKREGQRSIRLSKAYRAFYEIDKTGAVHFVEVIEVNKHVY